MSFIWPAFFDGGLELAPAATIFRFEATNRNQGDAMVRVDRSPLELEQALDAQLRFLRASCEAYDAGFEDEASRIAVTLRILLHDKGASRSVLGQLGRIEREFISTAIEPVPGNKLEYYGLVACGLDPSKGWLFLPHLDSFPSRNLRFTDWWKQMIFSDSAHGPMTRERLVLSVAEQDGGAHVDPSLDAAYANIKTGQALGLHFSPPLKLGPGAASPAQAAVRQIGHEVLKTLVPGYECEFKDHGCSMLMASMSLSTTAPSSISQPIRKPGRNEKCPCGSGEKSKRCCYKIRP